MAATSVDAFTPPRCRGAAPIRRALRNPSSQARRPGSGWAATSPHVSVGHVAEVRGAAGLAGAAAMARRLARAPPDHGKARSQLQAGRIRHQAHGNVGSVGPGEIRVLPLCRQGIEKRPAGRRCRKITAGARQRSGTHPMAGLATTQQTHDVLECQCNGIGPRRAEPYRFPWTPAPFPSSGGELGQMAAAVAATTPGAACCRPLPNHTAGPQYRSGYRRPDRQLPQLARLLGRRRPTTFAAARDDSRADVRGRAGSSGPSSAQ